MGNTNKLVADNPIDDLVYHPSYYTNSDTGIECIQAIRASMSFIEYCGWLKGTIEKYVWRYKNKENPIRDLKKARFFIDELIKVLEEAEKEGAL